MTATKVAEAARPGTAARGGGRHTLFHLQALRGLAASLVVLSHCADSLGQHGLLPPGYSGRLAISGYFGVSTFFMISGFIIYKTSRTSFGSARGAGRFVLKRLIRIFPVYWIATALFIVLSPHRNEFSAADMMFSLVLVPHVIPQAGNMHPVVGQGWTLQYEMLFYAVFTVGMLLPRRAGPAAIVAVLAGSVLAGAAVMPLSDMAEPLTLAAYWTRPIVLLFAVGIGFGILHERMPQGFSVPRPFRLMLGVLGLWFLYSLGGPLSDVEMMRFPMVTATWVLSAAWVFLSIFGRSGEGWFEVAAEAFGDASYSTYLFHTFILSVLLRLGVIDVSPMLFVAAALAGANLFGYAMYRLAERPILLAARRLLLRDT